MIKSFLYQTFGIDLRGKYVSDSDLQYASMDYSNPLYGQGTGLFKDDLPEVIQRQKDLASQMQLVYRSDQFQDKERQTQHHDQQSA